MVKRAKMVKILRGKISPECRTLAFSAGAPIASRVRDRYRLNE